MPTVRQAAIAAGLWWVGFAAVVVSGRLDARANDLFAHVSYVAMGVIYVSLGVRAARAAAGPLRPAWTFLTIGLACWLLGDVLTVCYGLGRGDMPFPSWADAAYLAFFPLVCVALIRFPAMQSWGIQRRMILDGLIVACSTFIISWLLVMRDLSQTREGGMVQFLVALAYPASGVVAITIGSLSLIRVAPGLRLPLTLLVCALVAEWVGDSIWAYQTNTTGFWSQGVGDHLFFSASTLLILLTLIAAQWAQPDPVSTDTPPTRFSLWLPLIPLIVAALVAAVADPAAVREAPVMVPGAALIAATLLRQHMQASEFVGRDTEIRHLAERLTSELASAAHYVASILPGPLDGPVRVTSRYLPASAVGGDSFGYQWIDEDHLLCYLIDVAGHGVKPALLSTSVHNLLRSGGLPLETLLAPDAVLCELNTRFSMDDHDGHYFTIWYGVYQALTRLLRYANAGHPPPLILTAEGDAIALSAASVPVGMFLDTDFAVDTVTVPLGARLVLYSDGVLDDTAKPDNFIAVCQHTVGEPAVWLDSVLASSPAGDDDRSLVLLEFT